MLLRNRRREGNAIVYRPVLRHEELLRCGDRKTGERKEGEKQDGRVFQHRCCLFLEAPLTHC
jgi:hypothetical protein